MREERKAIAEKRRKLNEERERPSLPPIKAVACSEICKRRQMHFRHHHPACLLSISQLRVSPPIFGQKWAKGASKAFISFFLLLRPTHNRMDPRDHAVAHKNTTERMKAETGPSSRTKRTLSPRTLSPSTKESSPPSTLDHDVDNTAAHSSATEGSERESSSCTICLNAYEDRAVLETCHRKGRQVSCFYACKPTYK